MGMNAHVRAVSDNIQRTFIDAEVPHEARWYGDRWLLQRGFEMRVCKLCGQSEDVHVAAL